MQARQELISLVLAQAVMTLGVSLITWFITGHLAGVSTLLGGVSYWLPNTFFALYLIFKLFLDRQVNPVAFFLGEIFKVALIVTLLWLLGNMTRQWLVWPAVLLGLVFTSKAYILLWVFRKLSCFTKTKISRANIDVKNY